MGTLQQQQRNLWENGINPGVTSKFILKIITLKRFIIITPNFDIRYQMKSLKYFQNLFRVGPLKRVFKHQQ